MIIILGIISNANYDRDYDDDSSDHDKMMVMIIMMI